MSKETLRLARDKLSVICDIATTREVLDTAKEAIAAIDAAGEIVPNQDDCARPDLLEKLTYHAYERDDMTIDELLQVLSKDGYRKVPQRTQRQLEMQLLALLAGSPAPSDQPAQAVEAIPEGWKRIPIKPTEEMINAAERVKYPLRMSKTEYYTSVIETLIAAAPPIPAQTEGSEI